MAVYAEKALSTFMFNASVLYKEKCPELSRFLLQLPFTKAHQSNIFSGLPQSNSACLYCYQWFRPGNHRVRLSPKRRPSARVQSILLRKAKGKRLSLKQKVLLQRFQKSSSVLMATCHACSKTSRHKGMDREFLTTLSKNHSTPGSAGKYRTPQSGRSSLPTSKTPGKDKTPSSTPRSSISSTVSASSTASSKSSSKAKNWVVQRLSKLLLREDNQGSKKGGLKDFLSSL